MKVTIPDQLKSDVPQGRFGKILSATPVVMAVVATMLAGLASSEMTRAQYDRAFGAQQQSKAGDQWSFFQAKRLRGVIQRNTADLLQNTGTVRPITSSLLKEFATKLPSEGDSAKAKTEVLAILDSPAVEPTLQSMRSGELPPVPAMPDLDPKVKAAIEAIESTESEDRVTVLVAEVKDQTLDAGLRAARDQVQALDAATKPTNQMIDRLETLLGALHSGGLEKSATATAGEGFSINRDFTAARLRYAAVRYEAEARLNQAIANFYELKVRKCNLSAERHHARSQRFFFGMLGAQLGVIIATFAMATRQRNLLWSLAAAAGLAAIAFAVYVYLYV
jgi:hypothetical protein